MPTEHAATVEPITAFTDEGDWWSGAVWIGQVDDRDITPGPLRLIQGEPFDTARFLVWTADTPRGFVEVAVEAGFVDGEQLMSKVAQLPRVEGELPVPEPPFSVILCTKDRPDQLRDTLASLVDLDYPSFEIVVVDNAPASGLTPPVVAEFASRGVRMVSATRRGLAVARNVGIESARHEFIAFTDDDVLVDRRWLKNLARGFSRAADVVCVTGMVPTAEVLTAAQSYFDRRVGWASQCRPSVYDMARPPADDPLFPLRVARFGTGANIAFRRSAVRKLGGFDEGMGVGSPTGGGEDIDMFVRVLLAGRALVYEPGALIWHRHRKTHGGVGDTDLQLRPRAGRVDHQADAAPSNAVHGGDARRRRRRAPAAYHRRRGSRRQPARAGWTHQAGTSRCARRPSGAAPVADGRSKGVAADGCRRVRGVT